MKIIAHRGYSTKAPENTLAAVRLAVGIRADGVEIDVRLTRDGKLAVFHDDDTRRISPEQPPLRISKHTLGELKKYDIGSWKNARFKNERVPGLKEITNTLSSGMEIFIELKSAETDEILAALDRVIAPPARGGFQASRAIVMSFHDDLVRIIKKARPQWRVLRLLHKQPSPTWIKRFAADVRAGRLDGIGQSRRWALPQKDYNKLLEAGALLSVWTVNDPADAKLWLKRGFHYLTSDDPVMISAALSREASAR